jgi:HlyD family secretion protein
MNKRIPAAVVVLAVAGGAGWYFWPRDEVPDDGRLQLYGNIDVREVELGFRVDGRLAAMHFEEGDVVEAGKVIAELDPQPFEDEVMLAEAEVALQQANLDKFESGARPAEIAQARSLVAERQSEVDNVAVTLERQQRLVASGYATRQTIDDLVAQRREAEARLTSAREALDLMLEGFREEDIAAAQANLQMAEARLAAALTRLSDAQVAAPNSGVLISRIREPGAILGAGEPVYTLSLTDPVWARAYVAEPDLGRVHPGMAAQVFTDSAPDHAYAGQIGFISPVAEFTPKTVETADLRTDLVYRLRVVITEPDQGLRQGMPVTVVLMPDAE